MKPSPKMAKFVLTTCGRVLGPAEAGLHEGEPRLHEDHEDRPDDHPQHVEAAPDRRRRLEWVLTLGERDAAGHERDDRRDERATDEVPSPRFLRNGSPLGSRSSDLDHPPGAIRRQLRP